jgi:hypothetical protein
MANAVPGFVLGRIEGFGMRWVIGWAVLAMLVPQAVDAAPKRPAKAAHKAGAKAKGRKPVAAPKPPPEKPRFLIPKAVVMRPMTPAEARAHAVWNMRAALNVAALQCQYSRWLKAVPNYNDMLNNHSEELGDAVKVLRGHFTRYFKKAGPTEFDRFNTRLYSSYVTLDATFNYCDVAGRIGKDVRGMKPGTLYTVAPAAMADLRAALARIEMTPVLTAQPLNLPPVPLIPPPQD